MVLRNSLATRPAAGVDALLLVDLPPEEAGEVLPLLRAEGLALITLLAPTTPPERMKELAAAAEGYLYYVSMTGGDRSQEDNPRLMSGMPSSPCSR